MVLNFLRISCLIVFSGLFLVACAEPVITPICEDNGVERPCTKKELSVIDDVTYIITSVRNYQTNDADNAGWFVHKKTKSRKPKVEFYGEAHPQVLGRIQTLGEINNSLMPGDVMLLEGADRKIAHFGKCGLKFIASIFIQLQFQRMGRSYSDIFEWKKKAEYAQLFKNTEKSYDLSGLSIADMKCGYWDDSDAIEKSVTNKARDVVQYLEVRNISMTKAIDEGLKKYSRVLINTGLAHMPLGDTLIFKHDNAGYFKTAQHSMDDVYKIIDMSKKQAHNQRSFKVDDATGTSKVIFEYLKNNDIPFVEAIHGKMLL